MSRNITLAGLSAADDLDSAIQRLEAAARVQWADTAVRGRRWTFWMRLSWAWPVSEVAAQKHVEQWATRLSVRIPGAAVFVGLHRDTERRHAHALVYIPRGAATRSNKPWEWLRGCAQTWHQRRWRHGLIWLDRYSPPRSAEERQHGAAEYIAKDVGSVVRIGAAPVYQPERKRRR